MATSAPAASNLIPHHPAAIDRPRLIEQINSGFQRLILITAPPGYGKTTLAAQYARQSGLPVIWHTISERERDVSRLYDHSLAVFDAILPGFREGLPPASEIPAEELAARISEKLYQMAPGPVLYVLDDLHLLDESAGAERWLAALMQTLPETCRLLLVSRSVPTLTYIELVVRQEIQIVKQQHLRMLEEEVSRLAHAMQNKERLDGDVHDLVARLEGWPAGLALAFQPDAGGLGGQVIGGYGEGVEAVFWSLANGLFRVQSPDLQRFLLASSVPAVLTPEICTTALSLANAESWLEKLQSRNLFLSRIAGGLTYHALFRQYLQQKLRQQNPERFIELHTSAAHWFEARDDLDAAFNHYLEAGETSTASTIAERAAVAWFGEGRLETLLRWNEQLESAGGQAPTLLSMCALIQLNHYEFEAATEKLDRGEHLFSQLEDQEGLDEVRLLRATISMLRGEHAEAIRLAQPLSSRPAASMRGRALRIIGAAHMNRGELQTALSYFEPAIGLMREAGLVSSLSHLLQDVQHTCTRLGRLDEAGEYLQEVVALRRSLGGAGALAMALNNLGHYYYQLGSYAQAERTFEEGLRLIAGIPDRRTKTYLLCSLGDLERDLGQFSRAERLYEQALEHLTNEADPGLHSLILISMATLRRWQERFQDALLLAETALNIAEENESGFEAALARAAWQLAHAESTSSLAGLPQLDAALDQLRASGARFEYVGACTACALLHFRQDRPAQADAYLDQALAIADEIGTAQPLAAEVSRNSLQDTSLIDNHNAELARQHLKFLREAAARRHRGFPTEPAAPRTYSLTVYTLGRDEVERDGKAIDSSQWRAAPARELFYYLLFNGAQNKEAIGLVFWPDYDDRQIRGLVHTTLHRARKALGADVVVYNDGRYQLNADLTIWCDALEVERMASRAVAIPPHNVRAEDLWQRIVDLYQGDFLHTFDRDWIAFRRQKLANLHLQALVGLGGCAYARGDLAGALDHYRQALEADPYQERIHLEILRCYAQMGQLHEMTAHFRQTETLFQDELGVDLSDELKDFYHSQLA